MRPDLAAEIHGDRDAVALAVANEVTGGDEEAVQHLEFLATAVDMAAPDAFAAYARWCGGVALSKGAAVEPIAAGFEAIRRELSARISSEAAAAAGEVLDAGVAALAAPPEGDSRAAGSPPVSDACRRYLEAAVNGSRREALAIVRAELDKGNSMLDVYIDIFQTALYEIGRRWAANGLTVAEEHMATATTQFILSVLYEEMPRPSEHRGSAVITGIDNELHQVGANIVADALDADGWDVHFIGTNMPNDGILSAIEVHEPALVGISATRMANVGRVRDLIADIRGRKQAAPRIIVGGGAFRANPELWREVGADGFAPDARSALVLARA